MTASIDCPCRTQRAADHRRSSYLSEPLPSLRCAECSLCLHVIDFAFFRTASLPCEYCSFYLMAAFPRLNYSIQPWPPKIVRRRIEFCSSFPHDSFPRPLASLLCDLSALRPVRRRSFFAKLHHSLVHHPCTYRLSSLLTSLCIVLSFAGAPSPPSNRTYLSIASHIVLALAIYSSPLSILRR